MPAAGEESHDNVRQPAKVVQKNSKGVTMNEATLLAAVEGYIRGWYEGDPARTTRCLHPQLAKHLVKDDATIEGLDAATLIGYVHERVGTTPPTIQQQEIEILGVYGNITSVRAEMNEWVYFLHLDYFNDEWKIVNAIWSRCAEQQERPALDICRR